jgi:tetratricopeptide (TPR) repeat protein
MKFSKFYPLTLGLVLALLISGCANQPKEKTAKQDGEIRWRMARAGVLYSLAREQFENGNLDDSRKTINNALKYAPDHVMIRLLSSKLSIEQAQLDQAEAELNMVRELDPKNAEAEYLTGVIYQRWQKTDVAYEAYSRACEKNPNELAYLLAKAEMLVQLDQTQKALDILKDKLNFYENSPAIRDAVGQLLVQEKKYDEAVPVLRQATALAPEEGVIREHYGMALFYAKQYREAASVLERLVNTKPAPTDARDDGKAKPSYANRADIRTAIGECQMEMDQPREARDNFELASQLQPENASVWLNLSKAALRLNDLKRAELSLKKAMSLDARSADANVLMGYLNLQQGKLSEALASFKKASSLDDRDAVSLCMSGFVLEKMGRSNEAIRYYSQALKIKPNDELATSLLAKVQVNE